MITLGIVCLTTVVMRSKWESQIFRIFLQLGSDSDQSENLMGSKLYQETSHFFMKFQSVIFV